MKSILAISAIFWALKWLKTRETTRKKVSAIQKWMIFSIVTSWGGHNAKIGLKIGRRGAELAPKTYHLESPLRGLISVTSFDLTIVDRWRAERAGLLVSETVLTCSERPSDQQLKKKSIKCDFFTFLIQGIDFEPFLCVSTLYFELRVQKTFLIGAGGAAAGGHPVNIYIFVSHGKKGF